MREGEDEEDLDYSYINLLANPERYTGYKARARLAWLPGIASCVLTNQYLSVRGASLLVLSCSCR